jgi:hypothetical protein
MAEKALTEPRPVRVFPHRAFFWSGVLGLAIGVYWCLGKTGPYRWLGEWQMAHWGAQFPAANAVLVLVLTLLLFLSAGYGLFTFVLGSVRYELALPFTIQEVPGHEAVVVRFTEVEVCDGGSGQEIVKVPETLGAHATPEAVSQGAVSNGRVDR